MRISSLGAVIAADILDVDPAKSLDPKLRRVMHQAQLAGRSTIAA